MNNTTEDDEDLELVEDLEETEAAPECEIEAEDTNSNPTADSIVTDSLASGALSAVCEIETTTSEIDDTEEARVQEFVDRGCGCDCGPNKSHCSLLFPLAYYRSTRSTFVELSHDELDLIVMGQVMAHTFQVCNSTGSSQLQSYREKDNLHAFISSRSPYLPANLSFSPHHQHKKVEEHQIQLPQLWTSAESTRKHRQETKEPPLP